jgi:hypothetical protein
MRHRTASPLNSETNVKHFISPHETAAGPDETPMSRDNPMDFQRIQGFFALGRRAGTASAQTRRPATPHSPRLWAIDPVSLTTTRRDGGI